MKKNPLFLVFVVLLIATLACGMFGGGSNPTAQAPAGGSDSNAIATPASGSDGSESTPPSGGTGSYKTEFPLPDDVSNFSDLGNGAINFQTKMSLKDAIAFYREAFAKAGYKEREINTGITDTTFSMVFDGHTSGKAIVIQGVDLKGSTNINIRFESL